MGTDATVVVVPARRSAAGAAEVLAERALTRITQLEARWSRFIAESEVSRLNRALGAPVEVSADTALLVRRIVEAWDLTGGLVDCTRLGDLIAAGYDRTFEQLAAAPAPDASGRPAPASPGRLAARRLADPGDIVVTGSTVILPLGLALDPGGIGKGLAADIVTAELMAAGAAGVCVNLGGDLRVRGAAPDADGADADADAGWTVSVDHPQRTEPLVLLGLADGAVASSTTLRRRWEHRSEVRHHLIDPRTGTPSRSGVAFATAVAAEGWQAEAMAKAVLLSGRSHPFTPLAGTGVEALAVDDGGQLAASPGLARFTGSPGAALPAALAPATPLEIRS